MVKEVGVHEVAIALIVGGLQTDVFVQVYGVDLGEIQALFPAAAGQLLIHADGAGTGGETEAAVGLFTHDLLDDIGAGSALTGVILGNDDFHVNTSFVFWTETV